MRLKYIRPVSYDQRISIRAEITEWENRLRIDYEINDVLTGVRLNKAHTIQVAVNMQTREMDYICPAVLWERLGVTP
jgi:acyl-CoA thioester hydrolase